MTQTPLFEDDPEQLAKALEKLDPEEMTDAIGRTPAMLQSLCALIENELKRNQVNEPEKIGRRIVIAMSTYFHGMTLYIPQNKALKTALRDIQIFHECNGRNHEELSLKHGITTIQVYQILRDQKAAFINRKQKKLF